MSRYTRFLVRLRMLGAGAICLCLAVSAQAITYDAIYLFGDDPTESASAGGVPDGDGTAFTDGLTFDSSDLGTLPPFRDVQVMGGGPMYVAVGEGDPHARPGADAGELGLQFNGTSHYLYSEDGALGRPRDTGYANTDERFIQGWVKPNGAKMNARQEVVRDSANFGIHITADNTWGYNHDLFSDVGVRAHDSGVDVDFDTWNHVMLVAEQNTQDQLWINGVQVVSADNGYGNVNNAFPGASDLSFGATVPYVIVPDPNNPTWTGETLGNYFMGILDNFKFAVGDPEPTASINLFAENDFIATTLDGFDPEDADLSGDVGQSDIDLLAMNWFEDFGAADLESRLAGDISLDGEIDFDDAIMLRNALIGAGAGAGLDFSGLDAAINGQVPEPTGLALALFALCGGSMLGRRRR